MSHEESRSKLLNKLSPLIEGQVPEFVQADHPVFVDFLKDYFQFLEAGRLELQELSEYDSIVNYIRQETNTTAYVLLEDGERVITESEFNYLVDKAVEIYRSPGCTQHSLQDIIKIGSAAFFKESTNS